MSQTMIVDDVWKMFQEMVREDKERRAETDRKFQEMVREDKERRVEMDRRFQETDRRFQETDRKFQETDRKIDRISTQIGHLGGRWGDFIEGLVAPACEFLFTQRGIPVHKVSRNVKAKLADGRHMEIDILVVNTDTVALVEVKSTLMVESVRAHMTRLAEFKAFFPEYADKRVIGAVAGIVIEEQADRFAMSHGLFVIEQSGETVCMANDAAFVPRAW